MNRISAQIKQSFYFISLLLIAVVFYPVYSQRELVDIDRPLIIDVLARVNSFSDYLDMGLFSLDVQPVRDFFFLIIIKLSALIGYELFGVFNLCLWLITIFFLQRILAEYTSGLNSKLIALIVMVHPITAWVLSWPTAGKHILAVTFAVIASYLAILYKKEKGRTPLGLGIFVFYLLAILSQPIVILLPLIFLLYMGRDILRKEHRVLGLLLIFTMLYFIGMNYLYYSEVFKIQIGASKIQSWTPQAFAHSIFAFSRSFTQLLVPVKFALFYSMGSYLNFLGLPVITFFFFISSRKIASKTTLFFILLVTSPLLVVYGRATNIFISDTYLLWPLIGLSIYWAYAIFAKTENSVFRNLALVTFVVFFSSKTFYELRIATDEDKRILMSYEREPNCKNALTYASKLLLDGKLKQYRVVAKNALSNNCALGGGNAPLITQQTYSFLIYLDEELTLEQKITSLEKTKSNSVVIRQMLIQLHEKLGDVERAEDLRTSYGKVLIDGNTKKLIELVQQGL